MEGDCCLWVEGEEPAVTTSAAGGRFVEVENTGIGGLGGLDISVPESGFIMFAKLDNSNGSSLTFSAVCTRKRHHCVRSLSSCTERFLNRVRGPSIRDVRNLPPTVSVSRGSAGHGPHSAMKAIARVCSCFQLLCTEIKVPRYPGYKERVGGRAISRVMSDVVSFPREAGVRLLTPIIQNHGKARTGLLRRTGEDKCMHIRVSKGLCRLSRRVDLSGGVGRGVRVIMSHLVIGPKVRGELSSSVRAILSLTRNLLVMSAVSKGVRGFDRDFSYPSYNVDMSRVRPEDFSFGGPFNTYPSYLKLKCGVRFSVSLVVPSESLDVLSNTVIIAK